VTHSDAIAHANSFFKTTPSGALAAVQTAAQTAADAQREKTARLRALRLQAEQTTAARTDRAVSKGRERNRILARA
jgi:hypothetical protein